MAYTKHTWQERLGSKLNRFKDLITGNYLELVNEPTSVTQTGTPIRVDWLNEMEQGIFDAHTIGEDAQTTADAAASAAAAAQSTADAALPADTTAARLGSSPRVRGNTATGSSFIEFRNLNYGTRLGYIGFGGATDSPLYIFDTQGKGIILNSVNGVNTTGPIREEGERLYIKYANKSHRHELVDQISFVNTDTVSNPDGVEDYARLIHVEGSYRYVFTAKFNLYNTTQFSLPYVPKTAHNFIGFRARYKDSSSDYGWGAWQRLYPTLYGTGAPPSTLGPGQIYVQY